MALNNGKSGKSFTNLSFMAKGNIVGDGGCLRHRVGKKGDGTAVDTFYKNLDGVKLVAARVEDNDYQGEVTKRIVAVFEDAEQKYSVQMSASGYEAAKFVLAALSSDIDLTKEVAVFTSTDKPDGSPDGIKAAIGRLSLFQKECRTMVKDGVEKKVGFPGIDQKSIPKSKEVVVSGKKMADTTDRLNFTIANAEKLVAKLQALHGTQEAPAPDAGHDNDLESDDIPF